jgi:hypothetical protein
LLLALAIVGGCGDDHPTAPSTAPPFTIGTITQIDPARGYLVDATPGNTVPPKAFFRIASGTEIQWGDGTSGVPADLQVGRGVSVWQDGPLLQSDPPWLIARIVVIAGSRPRS